MTSVSKGSSAKFDTLGVDLIPEMKDPRVAWTDAAVDRFETIFFGAAGLVLDAFGDGRERCFSVVG